MDGFQNYRLCFSISSDSMLLKHISINHTLISKKWQLPVILTNCIRYHHDPAQSSLPTVCGIVYCADRMVQANMPNPLLDPKVINKLDFSISDPVALRETILAKATIFLKEMSSPS